MATKKDEVNTRVRNAVTDVIRTHMLWACGDCKNVYTIDVTYCPNKVIDSLATEGLINPEELV